MSRTILAAIMIAGVMGVPSPTLASDVPNDATPSSRVDCWIGMKFGDQPGELIRGWICERQDRRAISAAANPKLPFADPQDVAAINVGSHHR